MKLLLYGDVDPKWPGALRAAAPDVQVAQATDPETGRREIADADAFFGVITPELLAAAKRLRWIQTPMAGLERYFFPELISHPVVVTNMRGVYHEIADHVLCFILCFARNMPTYIRAQTEREWRKQAAYGVYLPDRTLGIVGLGGIGYDVAIRAAAFGLRIIAVDPRREEQPPEVAELWLPDRLPDLLGQSDFVAVCVPETPATRGLFGREQFAQMKQGAYFINIGRGRVVQLDPLVAALQSGHLAGAALDVFEREPLSADHPLWDMDNVIITPHVAGITDPGKVEERRFEVFRDNLVRFVAGEPLRNVVDKAGGY